MARPVYMGKQNEKPETDFRKTCIKWLEIRFGRYFWHVKIRAGIGQRPGVPDTLCSIRGQFFGFEWKNPAKKPNVSAKQAEQIDLISKSGGRAYVIASWQDLMDAVHDVEPVQLGMTTCKVREKK